MDAIYTDDEAARRHLERVLWPSGPVCPHCGVIDDATLMKGKTTRPGLYQCNACREPFTVTVGTVYERSHIPLCKWVYATHLMTASKKGISAAQLHRMLGFGSYRTAWFMAHRLREAMTQTGMLPPLGGAGSVVEMDETYFGQVARENRRTQSDRGKPYKGKKGGGGANKRAVVALVQRGGEARVFHVEKADKETVAAIIRKNVAPGGRLHTDESRIYTGAEAHGLTHETTKHADGEYARREDGYVVHSNSAEAFFGVFKRGMRGVYQHCGEQHLQRYVTEFEFRHNTRTKLGFTDKDRETLALKGASGKRLTLRIPKDQTA